MSYPIILTLDWKSSVTSHFGDEEIRDACVLLGVKLIPKDLVSFVPISVIQDVWANNELLSVSIRMDRASARYEERHYE
jgi:hypothetical protein